MGVSNALECDFTGIPIKLAPAIYGEHRAFSHTKITVLDGCYHHLAKTC